jgi:CheY-like chemotaxis protein
VAVNKTLDAHFSWVLGSRSARFEAHSSNEVYCLFVGRKLLLADDSLAIQKVIDLTFTDEGMHVTTFLDGQRALEHLEQIAPDVILADIFMPGVDGYELCRIVKQSERFRRTPVMLLVGSFEPFDEAEARRAGADDVVTKPFQSIRELVRRVGVLLSNRPNGEVEQDQEYSTMEPAPTTELPPSKESFEAEPAPELRVFVEAASMTAHPVDAFAEATPSCDLEMQTADTIELQPIEVELPGSWQPANSRTEPTMNSQPFEIESSEKPAPMGAPEMSDQLISSLAQPRTNEVLNDSILDLGDVDNFAPRAVAEDIILDLDYEQPKYESTSDHLSESLAVAAVPAVSEFVVGEPSHQEAPAPIAEVEPALGETQVASTVSGELSDQQIDAIARRVVEHLSDKVVREIAWEVVPDLAELLIKQKMSEQQ